MDPEKQPKQGNQILYPSPTPPPAAGGGTAQTSIISHDTKTERRN
jgi:hypothetical protein